MTSWTEVICEHVPRGYKVLAFVHVSFIFHFVNTFLWIKVLYECVRSETQMFLNGKDHKINTYLIIMDATIVVICEDMILGHTKKIRNIHLFDTLIWSDIDFPFFLSCDAIITIVLFLFFQMCFVKNKVHSSPTIIKINTHVLGKKIPWSLPRLYKYFFCQKWILTCSGNWMCGCLSIIVCSFRLFHFSMN